MMILKRRSVFSGHDDRIRSAECEISLPVKAQRGWAEVYFPDFAVGARGSTAMGAISRCCDYHERIDNES